MTGRRRYSICMCVGVFALNAYTAAIGLLPVPIGVLNMFLMAVAVVLNLALDSEERRQAEAIQAIKIRSLRP